MTTGPAGATRPPGDVPPARAAGQGDRRTRGAGCLRRPVLRWAGLVWLGAFLVLLANDPGRMFFETKLSVDLDPAGFYASLWHLMDPQNTFGALNNQAIGYAMPMGPFTGRPPRARPVWLTERLWLSLIIAVGFGGLVKLAEALRLGNRPPACWAGWCSRCGRRHHRDRVHVVGGAARDARPVAVLPLTTAVRGPEGGVVGPAARSGAVVLCMSG